MTDDRTIIVAPDLAAARRAIIVELPDYTPSTRLDRILLYLWARRYDLYDTVERRVASYGLRTRAAAIIQDQRNAESGGKTRYTLRRSSSKVIRRRGRSWLFRAG